MDPVIRLIGVTKKYGREKALDDVSFDVPGGVVCALLGENGAGKSTTMKLLLGLIEPDGGRAEVLSRDSRYEAREIRRQVGYVSERPALYEWMTVGEIGWFAAPFFGGKYLERFCELAKGFDLPLDRKIKALSKGMRAKVSLTLAMASDPALLLLDEPTSGLDPMVRREFLESMVEVAAEGRTVFLSSHQIVEVERVADWVAILRKGKLVLFEKLESLKQTTSELTVTLANGEAAPPIIPGRLVQSRQENRQHRLLLRQVDGDQLRALQAHEAVREVESRTPSLEEIFTAYMTTTEVLSQPVGGSAKS